MAPYALGEVLSFSDLLASDLNGWKPLCEDCKKLDILNLSETAREQRAEQWLRLSNHPRFRDLDALSLSEHSCCCCDLIVGELIQGRRRWFDTSRVNYSAGQATPSEASSELKMVIGFGKSGARITLKIGRRSLACFGITTAYCLPHELWYVQPDPRSDEILRKVSEWLQACEHHARCLPPEEQVLPDRYIDVGTKERPSSHLSEPSTAQRGKYIALSYVWGGYREYTLNSTNYSEFRTRIPERTMPKTYRDMIFLARELGIRFVWIDALCIVQDSTEDWERQSVKMAEVYGNAYVTVCASNASAATDGFLNTRDPSYVYCGGGSHLDKPRVAYLTQSPDPLINHGYFSREPITSRAWCVQERVLSPRKLHFCSRETIWECKTKMCSEQGQEFEPATKSFASFTQSNAEYRWAEILSEYTACHLTNQSDRLPALSGIASAYAAATGDTYIAGHWASQLPMSLLWHRGFSKLSRVERYRAPFWAWPSVEGKIMLYVVDQQEVASVVDIESNPGGLNPFGDVRDARLKISGPLIAVQCSAFRDDTVDLTGYIFDHCDLDFALEHDRYTVEASVALDSALDNPAVFLLIVARDVHHERASECATHRYHCILLVFYENQQDIFTRASICLFNCEPELSARFQEDKLVILV